MRWGARTDYAFPGTERTRLEKRASCGRENPPLCRVRRTLAFPDGRFQRPARRRAPNAMAFRANALFALYHSWRENGGRALCNHGNRIVTDARAAEQTKFPERKGGFPAPKANTKGVGRRGGYPTPNTRYPTPDTHHEKRT